MQRIQWVLTLAVVAGFMAAGCDDKKPPRPPAFKPAAAAPAPVAGVGGESSAPPTYIYTPIGKRDPFKSAYKVIPEGS